MKRRPTVGQSAIYYICGTPYECTVTEVINDNTCIVRQGFPKPFGTDELVTRRRDGKWMHKGRSNRRNDGYFTIYCTG